MTEQEQLIARTVHSGEAAIKSLSRVIESLNAALRFSEREYWKALMLPELVKMAYCGRAKWRGRAARRAIDEFVVGLENLGVEHAAEFHLGVRAKEELLGLFDPAHGEFFLDGVLTKNRIVANIALSRVRRVVRALEEPGSEGADEGAPCIGHVELAHPV